MRIRSCNILQMMLYLANRLLHAGLYIFIFLVLIFYLLSIPNMEDSSSTLHQALRSNEFVDATLISVGISSQVTIHLIFETLSPERPPKLMMVTRWTVNIAYTLTNLIYWSCLRFNFLTAVIYLIFHFLLMSLIICSIIGLLHSIDPDVWTARKCVIISVLMTVYYIFTFYSHRIINFSAALGILAIISYLAAMMLVTTCAYAWYLKYLFKRKFSELGLREKICFVRMCSLLSALSSVAIVSLYYGDAKLENLDVTYVTAFSYIISANFLLHSIAYTKRVHADLQEAQVSVGTN